MNDEAPPLPEVPQLTQDQINRLICADWLESVAKLIRNGTASGFDIAWDTRYNKPVGVVQMSTSQLFGQVELKLRAEMAKASQAIPVQDVSEEIKDHMCDNPLCIVCNNTKNEQKS